MPGGLPAGFKGCILNPATCSGLPVTAACQGGMDLAFSTRNRPVRLEYIWNESGMCAQVKENTMRRMRWGLALRRLRAAGSLLLAALSLACLVTAQTATQAPETPAETSPGTIPLRSGSATFFIRPDGGSPEQCTGLVDAPYPGGGNGQPCAWDHPFRALPPGGVARIAGGDTLMIAAGAYMLGYGAPGADDCDDEASYDCLMSPVPSGPDAGHPTRLLGAGWDSGCAHPPELWGSGRPWYLLNLDGSSHVQVACLEITDHSSCIEDHLSGVGGSEYTCRRDSPPYGDWASAGLFAQDSQDVLLQHLNIHGLANTGVLAGRLRDWTVEDVRIIGNGSAGWNGDLVGDGTGSENHGMLVFRRWTVAWNGCGETYPAGEHPGCWGQEAGGYGDGVGTGTTGGHWIIEDSAFLHNTSDGLDLLYARLPDAQIEIRRTIAAGNAGNQIKTSGTVRIENSLAVSDCAFFHGMPFWNNDDDCRAGGDALAFALNPGGQASLVNATVTGQGGCLMIAECALDQTCDGSEQVLVRNSLFQGQEVFFSPGEATCFAWYDDESSPPMPANPFAVDHSLLDGLRFGNVTPCSAPLTNLCGLPAGLVNASLSGFDAHLLPGSPAIGVGTFDGAPTDDLAGKARSDVPDIGAYQH